MKKCIITVVGKDKVGIIAGVCQYLSDISVNILNISQTIVEGYFNMMMIVEVTNCTKEIAVVVNEMEELGKTIGVLPRWMGYGKRQVMRFLGLILPISSGTKVMKMKAE